MPTIDIADKTTLDAVNTKVDTLTTNLTTVDGIVDTINTNTARLTSTRAGYIDRIANSTYGLDKIKSAIDAVKTVVDTINTNAARLTAARATIIDNIGATGNTGGSTTAGTVMAKLNAILSKVNSGVAASTWCASAGTSVTLASLSSAITLIDTSSYNTVTTFIAPADGEYRIDFAGSSTSGTNYGNSTAYTAGIYIGVTRRGSSSGGYSGNVINIVESDAFYDEFYYAKQNIMAANTTVSYSSTVYVYLREGQSYRITARGIGNGLASRTLNTCTIKYNKTTK